MIHYNYDLYILAVGHELVMTITAILTYDQVIVSHVSGHHGTIFSISKFNSTFTSHKYHIHTSTIGLPVDTFS